GIDAFVGIHARNHRQQCGNVKHRERTVRQASEPKREQPDGHRGAERRRGDIHSSVVHQRIAQRMPRCGEDGDVFECPPRRMGDGTETDCGDGSEQSVRNDVRHHSRFFMNRSRGTARPVAMQMTSRVAWMRREVPVTVCPSRMSMMPVMSGTPGMRKSTLVPMAMFGVQPGMSVREANMEAAKADTMKTMKWL